MVTDTLADLFTRIRNAARVQHKVVDVLHSKMSARVLEILKREGYIESFEETTSSLETVLPGKAMFSAKTETAEGAKKTQNKFKQLRVFLRFDENGFPVISHLRRVSTPGRRVYARHQRLPKVLSGLGISILSTSQGVMSDREARKKGIGGEVLATLY